MLTLQIVFAGNKFNLCHFDADISDKEEIRQAFNGERWYNETNFGFDKIIYKEEK